MNDRFRKASAILATVALSGGMTTAFALLAAPAGAATIPPAPTLSVVPNPASPTNTVLISWAGDSQTGNMTLTCSDTAADSFVTVNGTSSNTGTQVPFSSGPILTASTSNLVTCTITETSSGGGGGTSPITTAMTYLAPPAPTVNVAALSPTSASLSTVGDGVSGGSVSVTCTQSPSFTDSGTLGDGSVSWPNQTGLATNQNPIICTGYETSSHGVKSLVGTSGPVYLPPPTPTVTVTDIAASPTDAKLSLAGDGEVGPPATIHAECKQVGGPDYTGTTGNNTGASGPYDEPSMTTNGQPVVCTAYETSNQSLNGPVGTNSVFLPPPAPTGVTAVASGVNAVKVFFTGNGTNIASYKAT